ncbi:hypothetical protein ERJ75_000051500 [Trypanosoma vivax]|nr:hypothetical protein ERJ75_000051500 [Trypanosoma vivax]
MLGEFCDYIQNGRQIILKYVEELMSFEQPIQLAILSAVIKMFIRDPVEMEQLLNTVLETLTTQSDDPDLRDRAYAYWRLLSKGVGVENMKKIVHGHQAEITTVSSFSDAMTIADLRKSINTAAAVFGMPFHSFLPPYGFVNEDVSDDEDEDDGNVSENNAQCVTEQAATGPQKRVNQGSSATTAAKHTDPLDDLLGGQVATSTAPQGSAPKGQSSLFDTDSLFGTQKTDQPPTSLPPLVLQDGNTGISVHCQVVDGPAISIALVNRRPTSVDEPILQINRNLMGFAPGANFTQLVPSIPAGETRHVKFPLKVSEQHFDDKSTALEVAIKGRDVPPLIFKVDVPPEKMLTRTAPLDEPNFMAQWQTLDQSRETRQLLMDVGASMIASPSRRQTLERLGFLFVTSERERDKRLSCYAKVTTALGMHGLVEIALDKTFPEQSYVCLRSHHTSFVMPVVMRIIRSAFQTQQGSVPPAAGARVINASTLDDLFA